MVPDLEAARLQEAPESRQRDDHQQDLEVQWERHRGEELPANRDGNDRGHAGDRPASAQEVEAAARTRGAVHDHGEGHERGGRRE